MRDILVNILDSQETPVLKCNLSAKNMTVLLLNKNLKNYNIWAIEIKIGACKTKTVVVFVFYSSHKIPPSNSLFSPKI